jgi:hypothetical protein
MHKAITPISSPKCLELQLLYALSHTLAATTDRAVYTSTKSTAQGSMAALARSLDIIQCTPPQNTHIHQADSLSHHCVNTPIRQTPSPPA